MADTGTIEITGLEERLKKIGELETKNPMMRKRINEVIRQTLRAVRKALQGDARSGLQMESDPRQAYRAIRMAVYRRIFGGQVNILQSKKAKAGNFYAPPGTLTAGQRGGNRRKRETRTEELMSYQGADRGFILRFLNAGAQDRAIRNFNKDPRRNQWPSVPKWNKHPNTGSRGTIAARDWFGPRSQAEMERAAANLDKLIDDIVAGIMF